MGVYYKKFLKLNSCGQSVRMSGKGERKMKNPFFAFVLVIAAMVIVRIVMNSEIVAATVFAGGVLLILNGTPRNFFRRIIYFIKK